MSYPDFSGQGLADLISLRGRTAVVTGGAAGLGRAICRRLAEAGANLVIGDLDEAGARDLAGGLGTHGGQHHGARLDVREHASVKALADLAIARTGRLDIWVNNAGVCPAGRVLEIDDADWSAIVDVNLTGTFYGAREAALRMQPNHGVIINMSSTAGFDSTNGLNAAHYVATKHAIVGLVKSLAVELGPKGIRAVGVAPTIAETEAVQRMRSHAHVNEVLGRFAAALPLGRSAAPDDVARVVLFLASDLAAFVTGSVVAVDGGELAA